MELVDSIHAQNAPPHRAEMRDESAKSKGKPPNGTTFVVQFVPAFELKKTPRVSTTGALPKFRIRGGGGGHILREIGDRDDLNCCVSLPKSEP